MENLTAILNIDPEAQLKSFKKGQILQRAGDSIASNFYVKKGLLRSYIIDSKGKEHIFMFAPENWIIADVEALEFNESVQLLIDCLEDCEVLIFNKDCLFNTNFPKEKIVKHGPFVMNTQEEIRAAMKEYGTTQFGGWPWLETEVVHTRDKGRFALHSNGKEELK